MEDTIEDGVCSNENKDNEGKKKPRKKDFKDSGINYWGGLYKSLDTRV